MRIIELNVETYKYVQSEKHFNVDAVVNGYIVESLESRIGSCVGRLRPRKLGLDFELTILTGNPINVRQISLKLVIPLSCLLFSMKSRKFLMTVLII